MRFTEAMAHLAVALRDPLAEYTELLRAVREGIDDTLEATERKLSRMAAEEGHPFDWGAHHRRQDRSPTHPSPCNRRAARKARRSVRGPSSAISARRLWRCCPIAPYSTKQWRYVSLPTLALRNCFSGITPRRVFTPSPTTTRRGRAHAACVFSTPT